jgi:hypothetical protein
VKSEKFAAALVGLTIGAAANFSLFTFPFSLLQGGSKLFTINYKL